MGTRITVGHPDFIAIPPTMRGREIYFYAEGKSPDEFETHWIDLGLVLEVITSDDQSAQPAESQDVR